ncbi:uncharacterized protein TNCV_885731 [Trichonephila clavipes]|nr:uncharacterized protein TNCV_885731 [Trichonephila clavipes]
MCKNATIIICHKYGVPNSSNFNDVGCYLFSKTYQLKKLDDNFKKKCRSFDSSSLPPCKTELYQHLLRVRYVTKFWKNGHLKNPSSSLSPLASGWIVNDDKYDFIWFAGEQFPSSVAGIVIKFHPCEDRVDQLIQRYRKGFYISAIEDDVFLDALQKHCKIIESALMSKCNMNNHVLEDARQALDRDRLLTEIQKKSPELKASLPKRRNPAVIVKNVPNEVNNEDLLKVISEQNLEIVVYDESIRHCRVRFTLKTFQHTSPVVIETRPTVRKSIIRQTRLKIIWSACDVDDFLNSNRCFNCTLIQSSR